MGDGLTPQILPSLAIKLFDARKALGISTREAARRAGRHLVSHSTIANYESGRSMPPLTILAILAGIYQRPVNWFLESTVSLTGVRYRNLKSKVKVSERHRYEAEAKRWLEAYVSLEMRLGKTLVATHDLPKTSHDETAADAAAKMRKALGLKTNEPIPSVTEAMSQFGIRVIELSTDLAIDGLAARFGDEDVVVLNPSIHNDRCRMNGWHEVVHIASGDCGAATGDEKQLERHAFEVASHFLLPQSRLAEAFHARSLVNMVRYKELFGISLAAMIYRAEHSGIIDANTSRRLWIEFSRRGWRKNEPGYVRPDRAVRFENMLDEAIQQNQISWREAESITGISEPELVSRLKLAMGISGDDDEEGGSEEPSILKLRS